MSSFYEQIDESKQRGFPSLGDQVAALRSASANPVQRIPTGLRSLDKAIVGVGKGEVLLFAARAGAGKSAFATQVIANNPDIGIIFFSLEMPADRVVQRLYAQVCDVPADDLEMAALSNQLPDDMANLADKLPYAVIIDRPSMTWESMAAFCKNFYDYHQRPVQLVVIDYLELVGGLKSKGEISAETVAAVANQAKEFAMEMGLAVVLLHQLNTSVKEWEAPHKSSLRYGGLAEADFVVGMWRPGLDPDIKGLEAKLREKEIGIKVLKNRIFGREPQRLLYELRPSLRFHDRMT